ncbi:MAG: hypothetical protein JWR15_296 [Prosthecobacter sp.]|nr:hypothetical protein [Prosthecobacter sp.]
MWTNLHLLLQTASVGVRVGSGSHSPTFLARRSQTAPASRPPTSKDETAFGALRIQATTSHFPVPVHICWAFAKDQPKWYAALIATVVPELRLRVFHRTQTTQFARRYSPAPRLPPLQRSSSCGSTFCRLLSDLGKSLIKWKASLPFGIIIQSGLQLHVCPSFLRIMRQLLISSYGEHHCRRLAIVSEHTRPTVFLQLRSVLTRPSRKIGETDNVLIENQIHESMLAQNNVLSRT